MAVPGKRVRIAFGALPGAGEPEYLTWVDVTDYVQRISTRIGRSQDLDRIEAGVATIVLSNDDGRFTPGNSESPYYPYVRPFAQVEVAWVDDATATPFTIGVSSLGDEGATLYDVAPASSSVFRGLAERWTPAWYQPSGGYVTLECVDLFRYFQICNVDASIAGANPFTLGTAELGAISATLYTYAQQTVGARIAAVLTAINNPFPAVIDLTGITVGSDHVDSNALEYMKNVAYLDGGLLYPRGDGKIVFISRTSMESLPARTAVQVEIGDQAGEVRYIELGDFSVDEQILVNRVTAQTVTEVAITPQEDAESQSFYLIRETDFGVTDAVDVDELQLRARAELVSKATARLRVDQALFELLDPQVDSSALIGLDLLHRVSITRRPDQGSALSGHYVVQGIEHDIGGNSWRMRLRVSAVPENFELGVATLGTSAL